MDERRGCASFSDFEENVAVVSVVSPLRQHLKARVFLRKTAAPVPHRDHCSGRLVPVREQHLTQNL